MYNKIYYSVHVNESMWEYFVTSDDTYDIYSLFSSFIKKNVYLIWLVDLKERKKRCRKSSK